MGVQQYFKYKSVNNSNVDDENTEPIDDFYLESWEICNDKNKNIDNSVKFSNELLISEVKIDPFTIYEKIKSLGEGSFGEVILVKHKITGEVRAMKVIKKMNTLTESNEEEVFNEINILKKMDHPNIIKIFEFYIQFNNYYLITEYCNGGDLCDFSQKNFLNEMQVAYVMYQIFSALNYCHKMKIIHRDLKPENILISKNENNFLRIKIADFGTSKIFKKGDIEKDMVGTLFYIAPEVIMGNYNFKCDLWSCGVIMYILLTHKNLYINSKTEQIIINFGDEEKEDEILQRNILYKDYNTEYLLAFSKNTQDLISKLLEKDVDLRINSELALKHKYFEEFKVKDLLYEIKDKKIIEKFINNLKNYKRKSILQETIIAYLIHNFPGLEDIENAYKLFNQIDVDQKGKISLYELYDGLSILIESDKLKDDIVEIFANLDMNKNNYITYEDLARGVIDKKCLLDEKVLEFAFKYFDKEDKGEITFEDISSIFKKHINNKDINETLKKIISEVDEDGDGIITYEKFCKLMKNIII